VTFVTRVPQYRNNHRNWWSTTFETPNVDSKPILRDIEYHENCTETEMKLIEPNKNQPK